MRDRDDHMASDVRVPDVPLPESNEPGTVSRWARGVLDSFGLNDWVFGWDGARRRLGQCDHRELRITMSRYFVQRNGPAEIRDTMLHEVAHALVGRGHGHDATWKAMARRIGARPQRCGRADMPEGRWRATCGGCSRTYTRHRRPKRLAGWHCRGCGRGRGDLVWRQGVRDEPPGPGPERP